MRRVAGLLALIGLLASCGDEGDELDFILTPQGYRVAYLDAGTVSTGLATLDEVYARHAEAVEAACAADPGLVAASRSVVYVVHDAHSFLVGSVWAVGQYLPGANRIEIALWS